jgi:hypothetical protein
MGRNAHRRTAAVLGLLAIVAVGVWIHRIVIDRPDVHAFLVNSDAFRYFYPTATYIHDEIREGRLPLWNPYQFAGQPFVGLHVTAALYPLALAPLLLFAPGLALAVEIVLHVFLAGVFTWLFTGRLGLAGPARFAAALMYMLSGPLLHGFYMLPFLTIAAWLPALLWALDGLLVAARPRWAVGLAGVTALAFLCGHAQAFVYEMQLALAYGIFGLFARTPPGRRLRVVWLAAVTALLAFGFSAPQLLPALELTGQSVRSFAGVSLEHASRPAIVPALLRWGTLGFIGAGWWPFSQPPIAYLVTLPALALPLAALGLLAHGRRREWCFFVGATVLVGLFLLGADGPVFRLYYALPGGNLFRGPARLAFAYVFLAAVTVAIGFHALLGWCRRLTGSAKVPRLVAVVLLVGIGAEVYGRTTLEFAHPVLAEPAPGAPLELLERLRDDADRPRVFFERTTQLPKPMLVEKAGMMARVFVLPDYEPSMPSAYQRYFGMAPTVPWHGRVSLLVRERPRSPEVMRRLFRLMSVRYYAALQPLAPAIRAELEEVVGHPIESLGPVALLRDPEALPRAYAVHRIRYAPDFDAALAAVTDPAFAPRTEAVVTHPAERPDPVVTIGSDRPDAPADDVVTITDYQPAVVDIAVRCASDCFVVLTDFDYPGWRASIDGAPAAILPTNTLFRGLRVPAGAHEIRYRYAPTSFRVGVALFLGALALAAALMFL